jgi:hypothetical protein
MFVPIYETKLCLITEDSNPYCDVKWWYSAVYNDVNLLDENTGQKQKHMLVISRY